MLQEERFFRIMDRLKVQRLVRTSDLSAELGVSEETARRDLERLERDGLVRRVHGGAVLPDRKGIEPSYATRATQNLMEKRAIARVASSLVDDGDTLAIDLGTTTLEFARCLCGRRGLTVVTNSLPVAIEMLSAPDSRVCLLGGVLRQGELSTSGFITEQALREFHVDKAFLGAGGITAKDGITDYHLSEAQVRKQMAARAGRIVILADHSKFGITALASVLSLKDVNCIVTNSDTCEVDLQRCREAGPEILVARC